jgi:16S rRNA (guanine527-N7)-methyltransferase
MKAGDLTAEIAEGERAAAELGGTIRGAEPVPIPELAGHVLIRIDKTADTPAKYPRRPGVPTKHPLGTDSI